jgi:thiol-disulfide isomerase/thioredoxin
MRYKLKWPLGFLVLGLILSIGFALIPVASVRADNPEAENKVVIYFFWGDGCPHCATEKPFLENLAKRYDHVEIKSYEVWNNPDNRPLYTDMAAAFGFEARYVPVTYVGNQYWEGFNETIQREIEQAVKSCLEAGCRDAGAGVIGPPEEHPAFEPPDPGKTHVIDVPLIGSINLDNQSLALSTALIAFVDGFNPCSLWVLSMLMALVVHTGSRKKIFLIGLVFITVTAAVYALFIAGLFTIFTFISFVGWIKVLVALVALSFALVNVKDYFWYKEGLSFTISDEQKPGIYRRMRNVIASEKSILGLIGATVVMAAGVSLVEFSCTAGFPVLWTNLLAAQGVETLTFILLLGLYMLIYQIDEMAIFLAVVFTLKASKLEEKQGRILKLVGGVLMLTLAAVMLIDPELMNSLSSSLLIFGVAFGVSLLVLIIHRKVLPRFGVYIGTEMSPKQTKKRADLLYSDRGTGAHAPRPGLECRRSPHRGGPHPGGARHRQIHRRPSPGCPAAPVQVVADCRFGCDPHQPRVPGAPSAGNAPPKGRSCRCQPHHRLYQPAGLGHRRPGGGHARHRAGHPEGGAPLRAGGLGGGQPGAALHR